MLGSTAHDQGTRLTRPFRRVATQAGQTLTQFVVLLIVAGGAAAVAVPFYSQYTQGRSDQARAVASVQRAVPAVTAFYNDNGTYKGMTLLNLILRDPGMSLTSQPTNLTVTTYCIQATVGGKTAWKANPAGPVVTTKPAGC